MVTPKNSMLHRYRQDMAISIKKGEVIMQRLQRTKENLITLDHLLSEALYRLTEVTKNSISTETVKKDWIPRKDVAQLLEAQALLEECQKEINDIDHATQGVENTLTPMISKLKDKTVA